MQLVGEHREKKTLKNKFLNINNGRFPYLALNDNFNFTNIPQQQERKPGSKHFNQNWQRCNHPRKVCQTVRNDIQ